MKPKPNSALLMPRYWPAWLGLGLLWLIVQLPDRWQFAMGQFLGKLIARWGGRLKKNTWTNLRLCFPEKNPAELRQLASAGFLSVGLGIIETGRAFWLPESKMTAACTLHGMQHAEAALAQGKGILLISPHFTCLEIVGRLLANQPNFAVMYRLHKKPLLAFIHARFRNVHYRRSIPSHRIRQLIQALRDNMAVWYAYDIDAGKKNSVFAPFFGVPAASMTAVSRLAGLTGAAVMPVHFYRKGNAFHYAVCLGEPLDAFPSDDFVEDATRLNSLLEAGIRQHPEQYLWQYQRFKTRPPGEKRLYGNNTQK